MNRDWRLDLFSKSLLKREKFSRIDRLLGETDGLTCLDIGSESGAISLLLRRKGGEWSSLDHEPEIVESIRDLVGSNVFLLEDESRMPFSDCAFDRIIIVDILEHVADDRALVDELYRIMKPAGELIFVTPHLKLGPLNRLRWRLGLHPDALGQQRLGYTAEGIRELLKGRFNVDLCTTYEKFFSRLIETVIQATAYRLIRRSSITKHAPMVTRGDLQSNRVLYRIYSLLYPALWLLSQLDVLFFMSTGYQLIGKASIRKA